MKVCADFSISKIKEETIEKLQSLLALVDGTKLVGWMKLWLYNHYIVTKLSWYLMMYDFSFSFVSSLEKQARRYLKKWSGLARCANVQVLYQTHRNKGLNLKNVVTFFKQMQLTKLLLIRSLDLGSDSTHLATKAGEGPQCQVWVGPNTGSPITN